MDGRTKFVVAWMAILYLCSWLFSLSRLFGIHFWDREYALEYNAEHYVSADLYNSTAFGKINATYFSPSRYCYLLPHVLGAIFWWNLYFLQLIPQVRYAFDKKLHRILGRCLMICAFAQTASGVGLALTSHSNIILSSACGWLEQPSTVSTALGRTPFTGTFQNTNIGFCGWLGTCKRLPFNGFGSSP